MSNSLLVGEEQSAKADRAPLLGSPKRATIFLSWAGRYFLSLALMVFLIGLLRRINLMLLLGDALLVMAVWNWLAARRGLHRVEARRRLGEWLFARKPFSVEIRVSNLGQRDILGLRIEDKMLHRADAADGAEDPRAAMWFVEGLSPRGTVSWQREMVVRQRGRYAWGAVQAVSGYPFGLVERRVLLLPEETTLVLPCVGWLHRGRFLRYLRGLSVKPQTPRRSHPPRVHRAAQAEFHGLRSYHTGDSPRLIHWRTSARRGELMVREFEDEPSENLFVVLDTTLPAKSASGDVPPREQFEDVVSLTATICWEWCRQRGDRLVFTTNEPESVLLDGVTGPAHARRVLECLAAVEGQSEPTHSTLLARLQAQPLPPAIVVIVALGPSVLSEALRHMLMRPVNVLDATRTDHFDFYTPPTT